MKRWAAAAIASGIALGLFTSWWLLRPTPYVDPPIPEMADRPDPGVAPNVVLVIGCTVRRDQLTPYGGPENTTPFLAELAKAGAQFEDVIAASSWTKASAVAMITGRHALSVGMVEPDGGRNERTLHPSITTLAEYFVAAGYETMGVTANPNLNREFGLAQGFDSYWDVEGRINEDKVSGYKVVERALELVDSRESQDRPLFLRTVFVDAHAPRDHLRVAELNRFRGPGVSSIVSGYRGYLRRFDDAVRALDVGLRERGFDADNTFFVVVADHGEGLDMPRHQRGHGRTLYGSMVQVPLIIRGPGVPAGTEISGLASLIDLPNTLLGLVGADGPQHGEDWSAQVRGEIPWTTRHKAYADTWFYEIRRSGVWTTTEMCQRDFGSTAWREGIVFEEGCFRRTTDPDFDHPLPPTLLMRDLERWRDERIAGAGKFRFSGNAGVSDDLSEQLEALGYVD